MEDEKPEGLHGFARLVAAIQHSFSGLNDAWTREPAFRQETLLLIPAVPLSLWIGESIGQVALLLGSILFLMLVEVLNSAIEAVVDRIGHERHELSRIAKDLGSAAVMLASLFPLATWIILLLGKLGVIAV